jgi:hypothetical protein
LSEVLRSNPYGFHELLRGTTLDRGEKSPIDPNDDCRKTAVRLTSIALQGGDWPGESVDKSAAGAIAEKQHDRWSRIREIRIFAFYLTPSISV